MAERRVGELADELGISSQDLMRWVKKNHGLSVDADTDLASRLVRELRVLTVGAAPDGRQAAAHLHQGRLRRAEPKVAATARWLMTFSSPQRWDLRRRLEAGEVPAQDAAELRRALNLIIEPPPVHGENHSVLRDTSIGHQPATKRTPASRPPIDPVDVRVALELFRVAVDALIIRLAPDVELRIDKVADKGAPFWLSMPLTASSAPLVPDVEGWQTPQNWKLPLVTIPTNPMLPLLAVRRLPVERSAAAIVRQLHERITIPSPPRIDAVECEPVEVDRRLGLMPARHRQGGRTTPSTGVTCRRCGMPLTDAASIRIGYGPECLERLGRAGKRDALRAAKTNIPIAAPPPAQWMATITTAYPYLAPAHPSMRSREDT